MSVSRYTYDQRYDRALEIYLKLRHKDVYQLIHKHNLFSSIEDKIVLLMDFDKEVNHHPDHFILETNFVQADRLLF